MFKKAAKENGKMKKVRKVQKAKAGKIDTRPTDTTEFRVCDTRSGAVDESVGAAHTRPDDEALLGEYDEIKRSIPDMSDSEAYARAARSARKAEAAVDALADSLADVRTAARREGLSAQQAQTLAKATRRGDDLYLRRMRPWSVESDIAKSDPASDELLERADRIEKSDPDGGRYQAMRRAARRSAA